MLRRFHYKLLSWPPGRKKAATVGSKGHIREDEKITPRESFVSGNVKSRRNQFSNRPWFNWTTFLIAALVPARIAM